ncbi:LOW QUALITY PROTEIN: medium-chain acyl-CoA ligase ACSF2, mitochondrial-like [Bacillus rossius redtenbacheri]|uniref:LOW QUALITY PROTEIN: medium-chain acyl-CoA ligase ACSF2, mitochondrial-like n=1 Tax=Bacillus rossius redtenbacheri TaxID=93214 RepID=UPI002FDCCD29
MSSDSVDYYSRRPRPSYWQQPGPEPLICLTAGQLVDWAGERYGAREAVVSAYQGVRWSFARAAREANELAAGLLSLGLRPGDVVALWGYNSIHHYVTPLATAKAGLVLAKLDPQYQAPELEVCLSKVGARLLIAVTSSTQTWPDSNSQEGASGYLCLSQGVGAVPGEAGPPVPGARAGGLPEQGGRQLLIVAETASSQGYYDIVRGLCPELERCPPGELRSARLPQLSTVVLCGGQRRPGAYLLDDVLKLTTPDGISKLSELQNTIDPDDAAFIHYTSGTTGSPKAAVWTHHAAVNASKAFGRVFNPDNKPSKILAQIQGCHVGISIGGILAGLHVGTTTVFASPKFNPDSSIQVLKEERCDIIFGTPYMYVDLLTRIQERGTSFTHPIIIVIGGSTVSEVLARRIVKVLPVERFVPAYGMTEGHPLFVPNLDDTMDQNILTAGKPATDIEVKVVNKAGKIVPAGTAGELWVRGYCLMKGYWRDDEKTRETITKDGWLKTGDQVILQSDGYGRIVGRIKDSIIRGSDNIFPKEVEELILTHPDVIDAQAFGVPDARWTEEVCVYIRLREGSRLDEQQLKSFCKGKVAEYRIPRYVRFTKEFPQNVVGKVDKKKMRENFLQDTEYLKNNESIMKGLFRSSST